MLIIKNFLGHVRIDEEDHIFPRVSSVMNSQFI